LVMVPYFQTTISSELWNLRLTCAPSFHSGQEKDQTRMRGALAMIVHLYEVERASYRN
jgi:hypothetical protein